MLHGADPKTGIQGKTMPDAIRLDGQLVEVKDVNKLSDSKQLRIQNKLSREGSGKAVQVITGEQTKVSSTVRKRYNVTRKEYLGPQP